MNTEQIGGATLTDISRPCTTWCDTSAHSVTSASQTDALCPGTHKCDDCPFASTRLSNLRAHIRASPLQIKLQCSECDYKSDTSQTLKRQYVSMTAVGAFLWATSKLSTWMLCMCVIFVVTNVRANRNSMSTIRLNTWELFIVVTNAISRQRGKHMWENTWACTILTEGLQLMYNLLGRV